MTTSQLFQKLCLAAIEVAKEENLSLQSIERAPSRKDARGLCQSNGKIFIRMYSSQVLLERTKIQENGRTIAHELAHLRYMNHGPLFWLFAKELCEKLSIKLGEEIIPERAMF